MVDLGDSYVRGGGERVLGPAALGLDAGDVHADAVRFGSRVTAARIVPRAAQHLLDDDPAAIVVLRPGVILLRYPTGLVDLAEERGLAVVSRAFAPAGPESDLTRPSAADLVADGGCSPEVIAVAGRSQRPLTDRWAALATASSGTDLWLTALTCERAHGIVRDGAFLLGGWSAVPAGALVAAGPGSGDGLLLAGRPVTAIDLTHLDGSQPWVLDTRWPLTPRVLLSQQPALAALCARLAPALVTAVDPWARLSTGDRVDPAVRALYLAGGPGSGEQSPPDPFAPEQRARLLDWMCSSDTDQGLPRFLVALLAARPDLQRAFPLVPGAQTPEFLAWADQHGRDELAGSTAALDECLRRTTAAAAGTTARSGRRTRGVDVVGFLTGELGIGESARLMVSALAAAGTSYASVPVSLHLQSRQRAGTPPQPTANLSHEVALICVNADLTPAVTGAFGRSLEGRYRIGMWYWEVEDFPRSQHGGFAHVDEVWVATDFVRDAISASSPVPVHVLTPPLPQRRALPPAGRAELGLPADRPIILFAFDYLSTAERKNPWGAVDAFRRAFPADQRRDDGPLLVIKSINANRRLADAERLRLLVGDDPDVVLLEDYLSAEDRDGLMAACDVYLSLHRSEGLGLTLAEAMSWGKPVVATAYSGNLQFMTAENSYLVPWKPVPIPAGCEPYPAGSTWAEPDLEVAAALLRRVLDDRPASDEIGRRAARDIQALHSSAAAGARIAARLAQVHHEQRGSRRRRAARDLLKRAADLLLRGLH